jgi:hypothetical protein
LAITALLHRVHQHSCSSNGLSLRSRDLTFNDQNGFGLVENQPFLKWPKSSSLARNWCLRTVFELLIHRSFKSFALQLIPIAMAAAIFKGLFGGANPSASPIPAGDSGAQYVADPLIIHF